MSFNQRIKEMFGYKEHNEDTLYETLVPKSGSLNLEEIINTARHDFLTWKKDDKLNEELSSAKDYAVEGDITKKSFLKQELLNFITATFPGINKYNIDSLIKQYHINYYENLYCDIKPTNEYEQRIYDDFEKYRLYDSTPVNEKFMKLVTISYQELWGLGPIDEIVDDVENINSLWTNNKNDIRIQWRGKKVRLRNLRYRSQEDYEQSIRNATAYDSIYDLSPTEPTITCSRRNGSRVVAVVPGLSDQWTLNYRNFDNNLPYVEKLIELNTLDARFDCILRANARAKMNYTIIGPQGTGKTTFLKALTAFYNKNLAILVLDAMNELRLKEFLPEHDIHTHIYNDRYSIEKCFDISVKEDRDIYLFTEMKNGIEFCTSFTAKARGKEGSGGTTHGSSFDAYVDIATDLLMETGRFISREEAFKRIIKADNIVYVFDYNEETGHRYLKTWSEIIYKKETQTYEENVLVSYSQKDNKWYWINPMSQQLREKYHEEDLKKLDEIRIEMQPIDEKVS